MTKTTNNEIGLLHNGECPSLLFLGIELFSHTSKSSFKILEKGENVAIFVDNLQPLCTKGY